MSYPSQQEPYTIHFDESDHPCSILGAAVPQSGAARVLMHIGRTDFRQGPSAAAGDRQYSLYGGGHLDLGDRRALRDSMPQVPEAATEYVVSSDVLVLRYGQVLRGFWPMLDCTAPNLEALTSWLCSNEPDSARTAFLGEFRRATQYWRALMRPNVDPVRVADLSVFASGNSFHLYAGGPSLTESSDHVTAGYIFRRYLNAAMRVPTKIADRRWLSVCLLQGDLRLRWTSLSGVKKHPPRLVAAFDVDTTLEQRGQTRCVPCGAVPQIQPVLSGGPVPASPGPALIPDDDIPS